LRTCEVVAYHAPECGRNEGMSTLLTLLRACWAGAVVRPEGQAKGRIFRHLPLFCLWRELLVSIFICPIISSVKHLRTKMSKTNRSKEYFFEPLCLLLLVVIYPEIYSSAAFFIILDRTSLIYEIFIISCLSA